MIHYPVKGREQSSRPPRRAAMTGYGSMKATSNDDRRIREIERRLRMVYGQPRHFNPDDPLDDLIFIVLSRMTQEIKYVRTYSRVRDSFPTWDAVRDAPPDELEALIREAGLAPTKAAQIRSILAGVEEREGTLSLHRLRSMADDEVERYLTSLPGVARKTALCVMLYALGPRGASGRYPRMARRATTRPCICGGVERRSWPRARSRDPGEAARVTPHDHDRARPAGVPRASARLWSLPACRPLSGRLP